jgi:DNA polymerase-1
MYWSCDIEADDFRDKASTVWLVCVENVATGQRDNFRKSEDFKQWLQDEDRILVGHNFLAYDAPVLNRLWGTRIPANKIVDTFVLSQMYNPSLKGGHGLDDWGVRLGDPKLSYHDFSRYSEEMLTYCQQDVSLTAEVYRVLCKRMKGEGFSERGVELEHLAWNIIQNKQKQNGFPFDQEKADLLYAELRAREEQLKEEIYNLWPPVLQHVRTFARAFKKDGSGTADYLRHLGQYPQTEVNEDGTYNAYDYVCFDLGSPKQRIQKLLDNGWRPVNFTEKGNAKIDEDEMLAFAESSGIKEIKALAMWCVTNARANMVRNWQNAVNPETGRIHGSLFLASTGRYRHSKPNTANIPGVRHDKADNVLYEEEGTWAYECRALWNSGGEGWRLVGIDGKGMQLRCLAHNVAKVAGVDVAREFIDDLLVGDPHKKNMARHGFPSKPAAKKAIYTILMGGGDDKIATDQVQFGWSPPMDIRMRVIEGIPGFNKLIKTLQSELRKTGRITLCDGTRLLVPSEHMVIPYLLQGDESRLMKQAMIYVDEEIRRRKLTKYILKVNDVHDEWQTRVREEFVHEYVDFALPCFNKAGESFGYLIPIEGSCAIGDHWGQTH